MDPGDGASDISTVAHGEGKFIPRDKKVLESLMANKQIVLRYCAIDGGKPNILTILTGRQKILQVFVTRPDASWV